MIVASSSTCVYLSGLIGCVTAVTERAAAIHQPSHKISAVASEIVERARAVELGIVQPRHEFRLDTYFFRAMVAIMNHDFTNLA